MHTFKKLKELYVVIHLLRNIVNIFDRKREICSFFIECGGARYEVYGELTPLGIKCYLYDRDGNLKMFRFNGLSKGKIDGFKIDYSKSIDYQRERYNL